MFKWKKRKSRKNRTTSTLGLAKRSRNSRLRLEPLEERRMLSVAPSPAWFASVDNTLDLDQVLESAICETGQPQVATAEIVEETTWIEWDSQQTEVVPNEWIIQLSEAALQQVNSVEEAAQLFTDSSVGIQVQKGLGLPGQLFATAPGTNSATVEAWLEANDQIESFSPNFVMYTNSTTPDDPSLSSQWGLHNASIDADIDAPEAWDLSTGHSPTDSSTHTVVAVIDTGVDYGHPDLIDNMWVNPGETAGDGIDNDGNGYIDDIHGWNFIDSSDGNPMDDHGHGTHCAGIIGAQGDNGVGVTGVNWDTSIMALKFLFPTNDGTGRSTGYATDAIECVNYATMMRTTYGVNVRVTSNSWGGGAYSQDLYNAIEASQYADILFVAAAGNEGTNNDNSPHYPSSYDLDNIIAVASTDNQDNLASSSCFGENTVDIAAPGASVYSTVPTFYNASGYASKSGTSMAAPHVAGVAALAFSYKPEANYEDVQNAIYDGADTLPNLYRMTSTGKRLNAYGTLSTLLIKPITVTTPTQFAEGDSPTQGTVSIEEALSDDLVISLSSGTSNEIEIPSTVTIPAGETSVTFNMAAVDDSDIDGIEIATISASVTGAYSGVSDTIRVLDNEEGILYVDINDPAGGDGLSWDTSYKYLQDALARATVLNGNDGDTSNDINQIWIADGTYLPGTMRTDSFSLPDGVTLYGGFAGDETSLYTRVSGNTTRLSGNVGDPGNSSDNAYTVVYCDTGVTAALDMLTISGGYADDFYSGIHEGLRGGGIYNKGSLMVADSTISHNRAYFGGGIYNLDGDLFISDSTTISFNEGTNDGGGISNNHGDVIVSGSIIKYNSAIYVGGGIINNLGSVTFSGDSQTYIHHNEAEDGAGIASNGLISIVKPYVYNTGLPPQPNWQVMLEDNTASQYGGGIYNTGPLEVENLKLLNNSATEKGGGLYNSHRGPVTIATSLVSSNSGNYGGGIYNEEADFAISSSTISDNTATNYGGGIYNEKTDLSISSSAISDNTSTSIGGGIYNKNANLTISSSTISNNTTTNSNGGGIANFANNDLSSIVLVFDSEISGNSAVNGGGIRNYATSGSASVSIDQSTIVNNTATSSVDYGGGGIYNRAINSSTATLLVTNSTISKNSANANGGGVYNASTTTSTAPLSIENSSLSGNWANNGGGIWNKDANLTSINSVIVGNTAAQDGAGFYFDSSGTASFTNTDITHNTATAVDSDGGGIYSATPANLTLNNSIVWSNTANTNPDLPTGYTSNSNLIGSNPSFAGTPSSGADGWGDNPNTPEDEAANDDYGDLHLQTGSSAIDTGNNALLVDADDEPIMVDKDGKRRIHNINNNTTDIGAYEFGSVTISGPVLYVNGDAAASGNGLAWGTAFNDLQTALTWADYLNNDSISTNDVEQIWIAEGTYLPSKELQTGVARSKTFSLLNDVTLYGGFDGTETLVSQRDLTDPQNTTILSGDIGTVGNSYDNSYKVIYANGVTNAALDGLTITEGRSNGNGAGIYMTSGSLVVSDSIISNNRTSMYEDGGGIYNVGGTLTLSGVEFSGNSGSTDDSKGGAIYNSGILTISDSDFLNNEVGGYYDCYGGAIYNSGTLNISKSTFTENTATGDEDEHSGGAIYNTGNLTVSDSTFTDNEASDKGGAIYSSGVGTLTVSNSTFTGNSGHSGGGISGSNLTVSNSTFTGNSASYGGGIGGSNLTVSNSTFTGNSASYGGGIRSSGTSTLTNSTFAGNSASQGGGIYNGYNATLTLNNSTLTKNSASVDGGGIYNDSTASLTLNNSIVSLNTGGLNPEVYGAYTNTSNVSLVGDNPNPLFVRNPSAGTDGNWGTEDDDYGDLRLRGNSPAINAGENSLLPVDTFDLDEDGNTSEALPIDLLGNDRIVNNTIDIGAYEYFSVPTNILCVDASADPNDGNNGLSWGTAYVDLQDALARATVLNENDGDTSNDIAQIWIADGTYTPGDARTDTFSLLSNVALYGGFIGTEPSLESRVLSKDHETILSGEIGTASKYDNSYKIVYANGVTDAAIDGLTITDGCANGGRNGAGISMTTGTTLEVTNSFVSNNTASHNGAGICNAGGTLTLSGMEFSENTGGDEEGQGGAIYNSGILNISDSSFLGNVVGDYVECFGGAIYNSGTLAIDNSTFTGNAADGDDDHHGGAIYNTSNLTVSHSEFTNNVAEDDGGAIYNSYNGTLTVIDSTFTGNSAGYLGGGIYNYGTSHVVNSVFNGNSGRYGGGIYNSNAKTLTLTNSTLAGNSATQGGGIYNNFNAVATLNNSTLTKNSASNDGGGIYNNSTASLTLNNSIVSLNSGGGNQEISGAYTNASNVSLIETDPEFVRNPSAGTDGTWGTADDNYGDLRIKPTSPAIDRGSSTLLPVDVWDLDEDGDMLDRLARDLIGNPRDNGTAPDVGAHEWVPLVYGDSNEDGIVDQDEFNLIWLNYGYGTPDWSGGDPILNVRGTVACDCNLDGKVDINDLLHMIGDLQASLLVVDDPIDDISLNDGDSQPGLIDLYSVFGMSYGDTRTQLRFTVESSDTSLVTADLLYDEYLNLTYLSGASGQATIKVTASIILWDSTLTLEDEFTFTLT